MPYLTPSQLLHDLQGNHNPGLYYIRARSEDVIRNLSEQLFSEFVDLLSIYCDSPDSLVIYIGKASGANGMHQRLQQDLLHLNPASFFRGVGAVMGKNPRRATTPAGVKNYRFNADDTNEIIHFMEKYFEVAVEEHPADNLLTVERKKIKKYQPIFNSDHNPHPSVVVRENRFRCRAYAGEFLHLT